MARRRGGWARWITRPRSLGQARDWLTFRHPRGVPSKRPGTATSLAVERAGKAVHEEALLDLLVSDLADLAERDGATRKRTVGTETVTSQSPVPESDAHRLRA